MNHFVKVAALAASTVLASAVSAQAGTVQLTLTVDSTTNSFSVFEQNLNPTDTVGLEGLGFDVTGAGGASVVSVTNRLPMGNDDELGPTGFTFFRTNGTLSGGNDMDISGFQNPGSYSVNTAGDVTNVYKGVGNVAEMVNSGDSSGVPTPKSIALPALIATGKYSGTAGTLTVSTTTDRVALLPDPQSFPTAGPGQTSATYVTHSPDSVMGETVPIGTVQRLPGDADLDGLVGFDDLVTVARNYGKSNAMWQDGDFNGDGTVGFDDLVILARNYGKTATAAELAALDPSVRAEVEQAFADVPEPSLTSLVFLGSAILVRRRRQTCR